MKKTGFLLAAALFFLLVGNAQALNVCDLEKLPSYPSVNASMLLVIPESEVSYRLDSISDPMKVRWEVLDPYTFNYVDYGGSLHKFGNCWICEFSGKTSTFYGNCGPTPFKTGGQFRIDFAASDFTDMVEFNRTVSIHSRSMTAGINVGGDGVVYVTADAPTDTDEVWITIYDAEDGELVSGFDNVNLTETAFPGRYTFEIDSLSEGTYYASFGFRTAGSETGGDFVKFEMGGDAVELNIDTDKETYAIGETVVISGRTKYSQVSASVKMPSGKTESLGSTNSLNQEYSHEFHITGSEDGDYEVTVTAGGKSAKETFTVYELINTYPQALNFDITDLSKKMKKNVTVQNVGNESVSLTLSTEDITSYVTMDLDGETVQGSSTTTLEVTVNPSSLSSSTAGRILVMSGDSIKVPIDVTLDVNVETTTTTQCTGGSGIMVSPGIWTEYDCVVNVPVTRTFTIQALDDEGASEFDYDPSSSLDVTDATLPSSVEKNSFETLSLEITPENERVSGEVDVTSSAGTAKIFVNMLCTKDIADEVSTLESDIESLKMEFSDAGFDTEKINSIFYFTDAELETASSSLSSEDYASAKESYMSAQAKYEALDSVISQLESVPSGGGSDSDDGSLFTWIIIIVVVVVVAFVGFFAYNKFVSGTAKKEGSDDEEAVDEELY